jgi:hypothetical protein
LRKAGNALDAYFRIARSGHNVDSTRGCMLAAMQGITPDSRGQKNARSQPQQYKKDDGAWEK